MKNLKFAYEENPVLNDINFQIPRGEFIGVVGPNGSGKSTLLKNIIGILEPQEGEIILNGKGLGDCSGREIAKKIGYVPQNNNRIFPTTVFDTVLMGRKPYINWMETTHDKKIVAEALELLNLGEFALRHINELSGGERQKVFIARALVQQPEYFILDEPTNNLDLRHKLEVLNILEQFTEMNASVIVAIHDLNLALQFCKRIIILKKGRIFADGDKNVLSRETIEEVYGVSVNFIERADNCVIIPESSLHANKMNLSNQLILENQKRGQTMESKDSNSYDGDTQTILNYSEIQNKEK
ncbi:MAG: ABC transporter ATP-binding protein [Promethearchaeia archaeon]